jgi:transcription elongation factor GreA
MDSMNLEELFIAASESATDELIETLLEKLKQTQDLKSGEIPDSLELMLESWGGAVDNSEAKANFCIELAELSPPDTALFRNTLTNAIKLLLPPYLSKSGFLRGLGLRDNNVDLKEVASRYKTLLNLKNNIYAYQPKNRAWGKITKVDEFTSSVAINNLQGTSSLAFPLDAALSRLKTFKATPETHRLMEPNKKNLLSSAEYRKLLKELSFTAISPSTAKEIAFHSHVPETMQADQFEKWWKQEDAAGSSGSSNGQRSASQARSIQEMHLLLKELDDSHEFDESELDNFKDFFSSPRVKKEMLPKDMILLAECLGMISGKIKEDDLKETLQPLRGKCVFIPESFEKLQLENLVTWSKLPAKKLQGFITAVKALISEEYLAEISAHLPLKCLNSLCEQISDHLISEAVKTSRECSCDILVWIWKNRAKHSDELVATVNMDNIVLALSVFDLPKEWGAAQRELKKLLLDNETFQKLLLKNAGDNILSITSALQKAKTLNPGERQSLLVKLSRHSPELREALEKGEAKKIAASQRETPAEQSQADSNQPLVTSIRSFKMRVQELNDIINIHQPENRTALAAARAHGDFRENAEYDAAKERRNFLSKRRGELEHDINTVIQTDFKGITPDDIVVPGLTVTLESDSGTAETYHLVGIWDGDPDNNCVSYKTKMGDALVNSKIGDKVTLPDGSSRLIKALAPLPDELLKKFADEA